MKKIRGSTVRILVIIAMFVAVVGCAIATSAARFSSLLSFDASHRAAGWWVVVNDEDFSTTNTFNLSLAETVTVYDLCDETKICPGSMGTFDLTIDCRYCEVDANWSVTFSKQSPLVDYPPIQFKTDYSGQDTPVDFSSASFSGDIAYNPSNPSSQVVTISFTWIWPIASYLNEIEYAGNDYIFNANVVVQQDLT
ncbi:MAG: hypothetical protein J5689_00130 [Clostridia bacterium]|nr:hypothetical protein [Clostridia bacterium]